MTRPKSPANIAVRRVRIDELLIFEITEAELEALEEGLPSPSI